MQRNLTVSIEAWIARGARSIGQITIAPISDGGYELRHLADAALDSEQLTLHSTAAAARTLSLYDEAGEYRPLKSAPTLPRGWRLVLTDAAQLRIALDHFYPALTALWLSQQQGLLRPVPLRETLDRQTGMYAASKRILDSEALHLCASACADALCLKRILWPLAPAQPLDHLPPQKTSAPDPEASHKEIPLLCHEACNILVAACREIVKKRERAAAAAAAAPQAPQGHAAH